MRGSSSSRGHRAAQLNSDYSVSSGDDDDDNDEDDDDDDNVLKQTSTLRFLDTPFCRTKKPRLGD